ncbi:hypothetical protein PE067_14015 [Paracoccus sp. DMF-8]|uniref:hypothetical protein n=1 Tax=Paracoccus sp. DMF-8 TaxID=3019445 RepID=UPI0023E81375|nr:hypothetical protein [Paracoccus sp. DMF-8]MDF3607151.1 hypothetical protein [Paracoccus sp. DMF-8]
MSDPLGDMLTRIRNADARISHYTQAALGCWMLKTKQIRLNRDHRCAGHGELVA